jgi:predicted DCC family thiol-disulfide oxidoreductase YuxK
MIEIVVIYDGHCELCKKSVHWVAKKLSITPIAYQSADLNKYGLSYAECEKSVHVLIGEDRYKAAAAVCVLLKLRGNRFLSILIKGSGVVGDYAYYWVARNRSSLIVKTLAKFLKP